MEFGVDVVMVTLTQRQLKIVKDWMTSAVEIYEDNLNDEDFDKSEYEETKELEAVFESHLKDIVTMEECENYDCSNENSIEVIGPKEEWSYDIALQDLEEIVKEDKGRYYYVSTEYRVHPQYLYIGPRYAKDMLDSHIENWKPYQG